jgi:alpha-2-macroglobulin
LLQQVPAGAERDLAISRAGVGRVFYAARLQYALTEPAPPSEQGIRIERNYERYIENGTGGAAGGTATAFNAGDLVRVTLTITLPQERRYLAVTDTLPAGFEAVDSWFRSTASDLARDASVQSSSEAPSLWFERSGFDHVEKHDDRVSLFATRLAIGRHQFSYLVRATTAGTFRAAGAIAEEMYAPEVQGRTEAATIEVR